QRRLFNRQEWPDLIAARADYANRARDDEKEKIVRERERQTGCRHQDRADNQHSPATDAVRSSRQEKRYRDVPGQRQSKKQARLLFAEAQSNQIENQNYGQRAVSEQASKSRDEKKPAISRQALEH